MKYWILVLITFVISCGNAFAEEEFMMVGLFDTPIDGKGYWCKDMNMVQIPLSSQAEFPAAQKKFNEDYKGRSPWARLLDSEKAAIAYTYKTRNAAFKCETQTISVLYGDDLADIEAKMATQYIKYRNSYLTEPIALLIWKGSDYKSKLTRNYDGVILTYHAWHNTSGSQGIFIRGNNANKDKAATVLLQYNNQSWHITLQPGGSFTYNAKAEAVSTSVALSAPGQKDVPIDDAFVNWMKSQVREEVTKKDDKVKGTVGAIGVRG